MLTIALLKFTSVTQMVCVVEGTQPIIFEDGTTMYISHEPPTGKFDGLDGTALNILSDLPAMSEAEVSCNVPNI